MVNTCLISVDTEITVGNEMIVAISCLLAREKFWGLAYVAT